MADAMTTMSLFQPPDFEQEELPMNPPGSSPGDTVENLRDFLCHKAVLDYGYGVSSEDLAGYTKLLMELAMQRFLTVGHDQYSNDNGIQTFETMKKEELCASLIEEVVDAQNNLTMALIQGIAGIMNAGV